MATGKVGVCMATSGPGATNLVTPIADAYMDSVPLVAITGAWTLVPGECPPDGGAVVRRFDDAPIPITQWVVWRSDETSEPVHQFVTACRASAVLAAQLD